MSTRIEWCDETWNPITGCTPISEGCRNCYARRMATRLRGRFGYPADNPFRVTFHPDRLAEPSGWRNPRRVFVCSMADLFHENVPDARIQDIWNLMECIHRHAFTVLTKRPERMRAFVARWLKRGQAPAGNIELGVSVEDQRTADRRIPELLATPAAVRFISYEPALGPASFSGWLPCPHHKDYEDVACPVCGHVNGAPHLDWIIAGAETGPGARPAHPNWFRQARDQCREAHVPFFYKRGSDGTRLLDGREHNERSEGRA